MTEQNYKDSRWDGVERPYRQADVARLRGSVHVEHSLARLGAEKFWKLVKSNPVLGALEFEQGAAHHRTHDLVVDRRRERVGFGEHGAALVIAQRGYPGQAQVRA